MGKRRRNTYRQGEDGIPALPLHQYSCVNTDVCGGVVLTYRPFLSLSVSRLLRAKTEMFVKIVCPASAPTEAARHMRCVLSIRLYTVQRVCATHAARASRAGITTTSSSSSFETNRFVCRLRLRHASYDFDFAVRFTLFIGRSKQQTEHFAESDDCHTRGRLLYAG